MSGQTQLEQSVNIRERRGAFWGDLLNDFMGKLTKFRQSLRNVIAESKSRLGGRQKVGILHSNQCIVSLLRIVISLLSISCLTSAIQVGS